MIQAPKKAARCRQPGDLTVAASQSTFLVWPDDASFWQSRFTEAVDKDPSPPFVPRFNSNAHASEEKPYLAKPSGLFG